MRQILEWQETNHGAKLLRMWGESPVVTVPETVEGVPIVAIGARCFSSATPEVRGTVHQTAEGGAQKEELTQLCGNYLEEVHLPQTVTLLENAAFYNCRRLWRLSFGPALQQVGSDLFLNCWELHHLTLLGDPAAPSGLRKLLGSLSWDVWATFVQDGAVTARLYYPEYDEYLDENTPAHIFNLHIHGQGYRYRQCFAEEAVQFAEYDSVFEKAQAEESEQTLCLIAFDRLRSPMGLAPAAQERYEAYLRCHAGLLLTRLVKQKDAGALEALLALSIAKRDALEAASAKAASAGWAEGAAMLQQAMRPKQGARYSFDEFSF